MMNCIYDNDPTEHDGAKNFLSLGDVAIHHPTSVCGNAGVNKPPRLPVV
jgi:hypothetical protein